LIPKIDHIADGTSKVISQYRNKPKFLIRLACYLEQVQHIEDAIFAVRDAFNPDTAVGFRLDWIGRKVGQTRVGGDDTYRIYIKARIRVNRSSGKAADVQGVAGLLLSNFTYDEWGTTIQVFTPATIPVVALTVIHDLLQAAAPAGVPLFLLCPEGFPSFEFAVEGADLTQPGGFDTQAGDFHAGYWSTIQ
jgi:hypothetical protein